MNTLPRTFPHTEACASLLGTDRHREGKTHVITEYKGAPPEFSAVVAVIILRLRLRTIRDEKQGFWKHDIPRDISASAKNILC